MPQVDEVDVASERPGHANRSAFWVGAATAFDLIGNWARPPRRHRLIFASDDRLAIADDWQAVGGDLWGATFQTLLSMSDDQRARVRKEFQNFLDHYGEQMSACDRSSDQLVLFDIKSPDR